MDAAGSALPLVREEPAGRTWTRGLIAELVAVLLLAGIALAISSHFRSTYYNNYVRMADAWLHGHMWIDWPGRTIDAAEWQGRHYGVDGPFPTLLVLPYVAFAGPSANQTLVAMLACIVAVLLAWLLLLRLGVARAPRLWLVLFFFAGTDLWWCAQLGDVWFFAHIAAVACTLGALYELAGKRRGWLVALLAFFAIESRFPMIAALPLYAFLLATNDLTNVIPGGRDLELGVRKLRLRSFGFVLAGGAALWVLYNELMWGTWNDIGHWLYYHQDSWGNPLGSPFRIAHLPYQIYSFFMRPPILVEWLQQAQWPIFKVDPNGVALTFTSPALVLAFFADIPKRLKWALWLTIAAVALPDFLYYLNGWYQFGMRHALDFEPFLLVLMAFATRRRMPLWGAALIAYSALAGVWGVWWWDTFMRTGD